MRRFVAAALALLAAPAWAAGPNGGLVTVADDHPVEMVATADALTFFLSHEDGKPIDTRGLSAKAYIQAAGGTQTLGLTPEAPNRLVGALKGPLPQGAKVVLSTRVHGHNLQARFAP